MAVVAYILLAHESAAQVGGVADVLAGADPTCHVVVHYDANAPATEWDKLQRRYSDSQRIHLVKDRVRCGWGEFGLVDGVVRALRLIREKGIDHSHAYLISGSCMPVRPLAQLNSFLDGNPDTDFIQSHDKSWILDGLREERYEYRFWFNFQSQKWLFRRALDVQRLLKIKRKFPKGLEPRFGSQWWCLTRETCAKVLEWIDGNPKAYAFFRDMWIPDECFFQTVVYHVADHARIRDRLLSYYQFNLHGKPLVFHDGHEEHLQRMSYFFARKISPRAHKLRQALAETAARPVDANDTAFAGPPVGFPFSRLVAQQNAFARPGQIYCEEQINGGLPAILGAVSTGFAVLYGPPALTRPVAEALRKRPGITVFGRLFHPAEVDFGPGADEFHGLKRTDAGIRDFGPALYLARILERCPDFAVFELCPGENPELEAYLAQTDGTVFLPLLPARPGAVTAKLLQLLGVPEQTRKDCVELAIASGRQPPVSRVLDELLETAFGIGHAALMRKALFGKPLPGTHYWGAEKPPEYDAAWTTDIALCHGAAGKAFVDALPCIQEVLAATGTQSVFEPLEPYWECLFTGQSACVH